MQLRLSRWGEIVNIATIDSAGRGRRRIQQTSNESWCDLISIKGALARIEDYLYDAKTKPGKPQEHTRRADMQLLDPRGLRDHLTAFLDKRRIQTSTPSDSVMWVLYRKDQFNDLVKNMTGLMDDLEKTIPEVDRKKLRQLSNEECKGLSKACLEDLKKVVEGCDPWLESAVDQMLNASNAETVIDQSYNRGSIVGIHRGDNNGVSYGDHSTLRNRFN